MEIQLVRAKALAMTMFILSMACPGSALRTASIQESNGSNGRHQFQAISSENHQ